MSFSASGLLKSTSRQTLGALAGVLQKGATYTQSLKAPEEVMLAARLYPDMFPLSRQVQIACDQITRGSARLAGVDLPSFPDTETTFAELIARTRAADAFCQSMSSEAIDARTGESLTVPIGGGQEMTTTCGAFLSGFILPNLYFHAATAYAILRHNGAPLGKRDFLSPG
ncbi:DUF1993 family protein [bacterium]|nr:DUF1993 family protein [bacterium]